MKLKSALNEMRKWEWWRSVITIFIGCVIMGVGYDLFISPYNIVPGGVYGIGIVLHNIFPSIQVGTFGYMIDVPLLTAALFVFGKQFGGRTIYAAALTPGIMNIFNGIIYPDKESLQALDPAKMLGGCINLSDDLLLAVIFGSVTIGIGCGLVLRNQATTGGTDIIAMFLQRFTHIRFSHGILLADSIVVMSGLIVIGFGVGSNSGNTEPASWLLSLYSLVAIYIASRVLAYVIDGASYDKIAFIISDHTDDLRDFIIKELDRSGTIIKASGMYSRNDRDMLFLVISRKQITAVEHKVKEIDPKAFMVVTDAYDTFGEGFKQFPDKSTVQAEG